jgi:hypothetical protein
MFLVLATYQMFQYSYTIQDMDQIGHFELHIYTQTRIRQKPSKYKCNMHTINSTMNLESNNT